MPIEEELGQAALFLSMYNYNHKHQKYYQGQSVDIKVYVNNAENNIYVN